jgi:hypothetical protein
MAMRKRSLLFAASLLSVTSAGHAKKNIVEDPFAYEEREREKEELAEQAAARQSFGNAGDFVISAERLFGYAHTTHVVKADGGNVKVNIDRLQGLLSPGGDPIGYSAPRLAFDVFAARGLSLGGAFGYGQNSGGNKQKLVVLSPRIGYAAMFGQVVGIWPRLGATYQAQFTSAADSWLLAATFDLPLVLVASDHAAFTLGPRIDWSFAGKTTAPKSELKKLSAYEYGFSAGVSLFF